MYVCVEQERSQGDGQIGDASGNSVQGTGLLRVQGTVGP